MNKIYLVSFGLLLYVFTTSFAGNDNRDALTVKQVADSCWKYMNQQDTLESKKYCEFLLTVSLKTNNNLAIGNAYRTIANYYLITNNYSRSIEFYNKSVEISRTLADKEGQLLYAECLLNFGLIFHKNGDFKTALEKYLTAEKIYYKYEDNFGMADVYNRMADIYMSLQQTSKGFEYNKKAYEYGIKANNKLILAKINLCYANNLSSLDSFKVACRLYLSTLQIAKENDYKVIECDTYYDMADLQSKQNKYTEALILYEKSFNVACEMGDESEQAECLYKIGKMHSYLKSSILARQNLLQVLILCRNLNLTVLEKDALEDLSKLEYNAGNYKMAYEYKNRCIDKIHQIYSEEDQQQTNFLNGKFQAEKREADINRLESEKQLQVEQMNKKNVLIFAIAGLLLLTAFLGFILLRFYRQRQKLTTQAIKLQKHKIRELENEKMLLATQSVLKGEENERRRMARDLHDGLGGLLSGVKLSLNHMKGNVMLTSESVDNFNKALSMLDASITELRRVAHNMMPEALVKLGLKDTLTDFCSELSASCPIQIDFQFYGQFERVRSDLEINAYRIIQELVNNAVKHAEAKEIVVQMIQEDNRLCFIVFDKGKGFDINNLNESKGVGLSNIKSRVDSLNGQMEVNSDPGKGTEITLEFLI